jgi:hypothetical protein
VSDDPFIMLRRRVARGEQAQSLLDHPVLVAAFDEIETSAIHTWRATQGVSSLELRENLHATVVGLDAVRGQLRAWASDGELARNELEDAMNDDEPA